MANGCIQQVKAGKDKYGKQVWASCSKACDPGKTLCPRHEMLAKLEKDQAGQRVHA